MDNCCRFLMHPRKLWRTRFSRRSKQWKTHSFVRCSELPESVASCFEQLRVSPITHHVVKDVAFWFQEWTFPACTLHMKLSFTSRSVTPNIPKPSERIDEKLLKSTPVVVSRNHRFFFLHPQAKVSFQIILQCSHPPLLPRPYIGPSIHSVFRLSRSGTRSK